MVVTDIGACLFGVVVGWVTYRTLIKAKEKVALSNIATVVGSVGGAAVTTIFSGEAFGFYCIGLFFGFFLYLGLCLTILKDSRYRKTPEEFVNTYMAPAPSAEALKINTVSRPPEDDARADGPERDDASRVIGKIPWDSGELGPPI